MPRWEFKLPDIGEGITEGEIVEWKTNPGDVIREDQPMVEVMTDKATVTLTAPKTGRIVETRGRVGDVVQVHAVLVVFEIDADAEVSGPAATAVGDIRESLPGMGARKTETGTNGGPVHGGPVRSVAVGPADVPFVVHAQYFNEKPLAAPAIRKVARDLNIDLKRVPPTGFQGRVTRDDVLRFRRESAGTLGSPPTQRTMSTPERGTSEDRVPFAGMRRKIAHKMQASKQTAAHFTFVEECDVTALKALRERLKSPAAARGVKLTFLPFIVKAVVAALKKYPMLNSSLDEARNEIVVRHAYHIGIATSTDAGLVVPVIKDADHKSLLVLAQEIERLSIDARRGQSKIEDLTGSTFTVTSLGAQGGLFATPIINHPEVGILGVHQMKRRPVVRDEQIVIGDIMLLSLSFDHRLVDGHIGAAFAYAIIEHLENPEALFLEMA